MITTFKPGDMGGVWTTIRRIVDPIPAPAL
jgi:hypothetical protein